MRKIIILLGGIFILWSATTMLLQAEENKQPAIGEMEIKIKGLEDRSIYAKTKVIELKNLLASEIEPFIRVRLSIYGAVQVNDALNTIIITEMEPKLSDLVSLIKDFDAKGIKEFVRLETETIHPKYVLPSQVDSILTKNLSPEGSIQTDDDLNAIMITDVHSRIERIKQILSALDIPPKQVLIEGKLVVAESDWLREMGVDISSTIGSMIIKGRASKIGLYTGELELGSEGELNLALGGLIKLGETEGKVSVTSLPSIVIQNNKDGEVYISDNIRLSLLPHIGSENFISLKTSFFIEEGAKTSISKGVNTTIMVKDGDTFALGGIEYTQTSTAEKKTPIISSIPVIGWLFKREVKTTSKRELIAIITPHILEFGESPKIKKE